MKYKKQSDETTRASVEKEMAKLRVAKSARVAELKLDVSRTPEPASTTVPGTVVEIIASRRVDKPDSAQIALNVTDKQYRDLRIDNSLTNEHGDDVKLKKGAPVEVTVTAKDESLPG